MAGDEMTLEILAIDPHPGTLVCVRFGFGPDGAGIVGPRGVVPAYVAWYEVEDERLLPDVWNGACVVEWLTSYGTAVGETAFATAARVGHVECEMRRRAVPCARLTMPEAKYILTGRRNATGPQYHAAARACYPGTGGGARPTVGTQKRPGPLYGLVGGHVGDAFALGLAWYLREEGR